MKTYKKAMRSQICKAKADPGILTSVLLYKLRIIPHQTHRILFLLPFFLKKFKLAGITHLSQCQKAKPRALKERNNSDGKGIGNSGAFN